MSSSDAERRLRELIEQTYLVEDYLSDDIKAVLDDQTALRTMLTEALDAWEYACEYKGDYFRKKHGDDEQIAQMRAKLTAGGETR